MFAPRGQQTRLRISHDEAWIAGLNVAVACTHSARTGVARGVAGCKEASSRLARCTQHPSLRRALQPRRHMGASNVHVLQILRLMAFLLISEG